MSDWADLSESVEHNQSSTRNYDENDYTRSTEQHSKQPPQNQSRHTRANATTNNRSQERPFQQLIHSAPPTQQPSSSLHNTQRSSTHSNHNSKKSRNITKLSTERQHGFVISVSEKGFGFVECIDLTIFKQYNHSKNELFFHISDMNESIQINSLHKQDELEFDIVMDNEQNKLQAVNIDVLPPNTITYETIIQSNVHGTITHELHGKQHSTRSNRYQHDAVQEQTELYGGQIQSLDSTESSNKQYEFSERDIINNDIWLSIGDTVLYDVFLDKRAQRYGATNIRFESFNPVNRLRGKVITVNDKGFGFISVDDDCNNELLLLRSNISNNNKPPEVYYHFSQLMDKSHNSSIDDEYEFTLVYDDKTNKLAAQRIIVLPRGTIVDDVVGAELYTGIVIKQIQYNKAENKPVNGEIQLQPSINNITNSTMVLQYTIRDIKQSHHTLLAGDTVSFHIKTKSNGTKYATNITVLQWSTLHRLHGIVQIVKDGYSFIDAIEYTERIFLHHRNLYDSIQTMDHTIHKLNKTIEVGDEIELNVIDEVDGRQSGIRAVLLPRNTVKFIELYDNIILHATVTKSLLPDKVEHHTQSYPTPSHRFNKPSLRNDNQNIKLELNSGECRLQSQYTNIQLNNTLHANDTLSFQHSDLVDPSVTSVLQGDTIQFNIKYNKRTHQQSASNISIIQHTTEKRELGLIRSINGDIGTIDCLNHIMHVTFHINDIRQLNDKSLVKPDTSVEYNIIDDFTTDKIIKRAVRIDILPQDSVVIETIDYEHPCKGIIDTIPNMGSKHSNKLGYITVHPQSIQYITSLRMTDSNTNNDTGAAGATGSSDDKKSNRIKFRSRDIKNKSYLQSGDSVQYYISTRTTSPNEQYATQIQFDSQHGVIVRLANEGQHGRIQSINKSTNKQHSEVLLYTSKDIIDSNITLSENDVIEYSDIMYEHKSRLRHAKKIKLIKKYDGISPSLINNTTVSHSKYKNNPSSNMTSRYAQGPPDSTAKGFQRTSLNKPSNAFDVLADMK